MPSNLGKSSKGGKLATEEGKTALFWASFLLF